MKTELIYLKNTTELEAAAEIIKGEVHDGTLMIATDITPFHPKGGGQPADQGLLRSGE